MTLPDNPAGMPDYILEKLLQGKPEKIIVDRSQEKFSKILAEHIETQLKDHLFHEIELEHVGFEGQSVVRFMQSESNIVPISFMMDNRMETAASIQCDSAMARFLPRLYFGAGLEKASPQSDRALTIAEIGLIDVFAKLLSKCLNKFETLQIESIQTILPEMIDFDDLIDHPALVCRYQMRIGDCIGGGINVVVPEHLVPGKLHHEQANASVQNIGSNDDLKNSPVEASVKIETKPLTLKQVQNWQVGNCVELSGAGILRGNFMVGDHEIYQGEIGRSGNNYSIRISEETAHSSDLPAY